MYSFKGSSLDTPRYTPPRFRLLRGGMAGEEDKAAKVRRYEAFLNETLRGDLRRCLEERDGVYQEQAEYLALRWPSPRSRSSKIQT